MIPKKAHDLVGSSERDSAGARNYWRIARWIGALALLLTPLLMMQISDEWHWGFGSFVFAGVMIAGVLLLYELAEKAHGSRAYRAGAAIALVTSFLSVWATIVRDDGTGMGYFLVIMAAIVGSFAAWFRPMGMARTMIGVAIMQLSFGVAVASAPSTASMPDDSLRALLTGAFFAGLWLISAIFFRMAAKADREAL